MMNCGINSSTEFRKNIIFRNSVRISSLIHNSQFIIHNVQIDFTNLFGIVSRETINQNFILSVLLLCKKTIYNIKRRGGVNPKN